MPVNQLVCKSQLLSINQPHYCPRLLVVSNLTDIISDGFLLQDDLHAFVILGFRI